jgi:ArsR family transcriptional regulator
MVQECKGQQIPTDLEPLLAPELFRALGDPNRLTLLASLAGRGECCTVSEMATCCPVDLSVVSRHLAQLRDAGIVKAEKRGRQVFYTLQCAELAKTLRALADALEACCPTEPTCEPTDEPTAGSSQESQP